MLQLKITSLFANDETENRSKLWGTTRDSRPVPRGELGIVAEVGSLVQRSKVQRCRPREGDSAAAHADASAS